MWQEQVKTRQIWELEFEDNRWNDEDDKSEDETASNQDQSKFKQSNLVLCTTRAVNKGEQLLFSYGKRSNSNLLMEYGFAIEGNPYDYAELAFKDKDFYYLKSERLNTDVLEKLRENQEI